MASETILTFALAGLFGAGGIVAWLKVRPTIRNVNADTHSKMIGDALLLADEHKERELQYKVENDELRLELRQMHLEIAALRIKVASLEHQIDMMT